MEKEIKFGLPALDIAVRKMVGKPNGILTKEDVAKITYLRIEVPYDVLQLSIKQAPIPFDGDGGDEWEYFCAHKHEIIDFIDNGYDLSERNEALLPRVDYQKNKIFQGTITEFDERGVSKQEKLKAREEEAKLKDYYWKKTMIRFQELKDEYKSLGVEMTPAQNKILEIQAINEIDEERIKNRKAENQTEFLGFYDWIEENPGKFEEDLKCLTGLQVLRICEAEIENFGFLKELKNLKVLELGQMECPNKELMKDLTKNLDQLCVWSN